MNNLDSFKDVTSRERMEAKMQEARDERAKLNDKMSELEQAKIAQTVAEKGFEVIKLMFEKDPVHAMKSLLKTYQDAFRKGLLIGGAVGLTVGILLMYIF